MARPKLGPGESERLQMVITKEEVAAIEAWRYENRIPSKSEAIRRLVQIGLETSHRVVRLEQLPFNPVFALRDVATVIGETMMTAGEVPEGADLEGGAPEVVRWRDAKDKAAERLEKMLFLAELFDLEIIKLCDATKEFLHAPTRHRIQPAWIDHVYGEDGENSSATDFELWAKLHGQRRKRDEEIFKILERPPSHLRRDGEEGSLNAEDDDKSSQGEAK